MSREGLEPAETGGLDWRWRFAKNTYVFTGQVSGSRAGFLGDRKSGWGNTLMLGKESGKYLQGELSILASSPEFKINDLGFIKRNDLTYGGFSFTLKKDDQPIGPFRSFIGDGNVEHEWNFKGNDLLKDVNFDVNLETLNWWNFGGGGGHTWQAYNDRSTRGGPMLLIPSGSWAFVSLNSNSRKIVIVNFNASTNLASNDSRGGETSVSTTLNIAPNINISFGPDYSWSFDRVQWVTNVDDNGDGLYDHFVFGELRSKILDLTSRANITFTPNLSFQLYIQPYLAVGHYERIKELLQPKSYEFVPYNLSYSPDFNQKSLRGNAVLRWEYRPGSTIFLGCSQNRYNDLDNPGDFSPRRDFRTLFFHTQGENIFMLKVNLWLNL